MSQAAKAQQVFQNELRMIESAAVQNFVLGVFETLGADPFWDRACSLSGKFHPLLAQNFEGRPGGLVRHVKYGVWWAEGLLRAWLGNGRKHTEDEQKLADVVYASMILHDLLNAGGHPSPPFGEGCPLTWETWPGSASSSVTALPSRID